MGCWISSCDYAPIVVVFYFWSYLDNYSVHLDTTMGNNVRKLFNGSVAFNSGTVLEKGKNVEKEK